MDLTVVLTHYKRPKNMAAILAALASQTLSHQLFVWDNSPDQSFEGRVDWLVRSSRNAKCGARWWLAAHAETPWVLVMDDDLMPEDPRVLGDLVEKLAEHAPRLVGAVGVILDPAAPYAECPRIGLGADCTPVAVDTPVDIVKGRFIAMPTARLDGFGMLPLDAEDDIAVSGSLGGGVVIPWCRSRLRNLPTGDESWCRRPRHRQAREAARRRWCSR